MKRVALVLSIAALVAVSCTPTTPPAAPATTTSSSTTMAGASAREAVFSWEIAREFGIDSAYYPAGSTVTAEASSISPRCATLMVFDSQFNGSEVVAARNCDTSTTSVASALPVALPTGFNRLTPASFHPETGVVSDAVGSVRIRW